MAATTPQQLHELFEQALNAGDIDALMALYEPECAVVPQPGSLAMGSSEVRAALQGLIDLNGSCRLTTEQVITVGDLALLSCSWSLRGTGAEGQALEIGGVTAEVARRQADGSWLFVIDNPVADQTIRQSISN